MAGVVATTEIDRIGAMVLLDDTGRSADIDAVQLYAYGCR